MAESSDVYCWKTGEACPKYNYEIDDFDASVDCPIDDYIPTGIPLGFSSYDLWCHNATTFYRPHTQTH